MLKLFILLVGLVSFSLPAKTILVNTTNNVSTAVGETNLVQAIQLLADGDTIHFALPGTGPFYLLTPPLSPDNGYPAITNNNVTIDGYSQPGSQANTNPILAANTAQIKIVLDSRAGGLHAEEIPGYGIGEGSVLLVKGATNVTIRGLCFLGGGEGSGNAGDPSAYAISFALGATNGHVNGCWIGVAPDRTNVFRFQDGITAFQGAGESFAHDLVIGVEQNAVTAAVARSQFNVIVGEYIPLLLEGRGQRIAGNFINVFPDGLTDYFCNGPAPHDLQAFIEIGRSGDNLVIGTDGDGVNDDDERNVFGGATFADDGELIEWYGASSKNTVIAGNYFGVAVDGLTRFTNSVQVFGGFHSSSTMRIGSDFDGVSDTVEGNLFSMNTPFAELFPTPTSSAPPLFADGETGAQISFRGNVMLGNTPAPFSYANGSANRLNKFTNSCAAYMAVTGNIIPQLGTNCSQARLRGSCALGVAPYTNVLVDVYLADAEGWTNGALFQLPELSFLDPATSAMNFYGFPQGHVYLGTFTDNGSADLNPAPGQFEFDLTALNLAADQLVTVAANYSADSAGTHNGRVHTSDFAYPVTLQAAPRLTIGKSGGNLLLAWPASAGLFTVQTTAHLAPAAWSDLAPAPAVTLVGTNYQASVPASSTAAYFRLAR